MIWVAVSMTAGNLAAGWRASGVLWFGQILILLVPGILCRKVEKNRLLPVILMSVAVAVMLISGVRTNYQMRSLQALGTEAQQMVMYVSPSMMGEAEQRMHARTGKLIFGEAGQRRAYDVSITGEKSNVPLRGGWISCIGKISIPGPARNPGGQDGRIAWLSGTQSLHVEVLGDVHLISGTQTGISSGIWRASDTLRARVVTPLLEGIGGEKGELAAGMVFGYAKPGTDNWEADFKIAGMTHLLVASGGNLAMLLAPLLLLRGLRRKQPWKWWLLCVTAGGLYVMVSGGETPVIRAWLMIVVAFLAVPLGRESHGLTVLSVCVIVMEIVHPMVVFSMSFRLTFAAVLGLMTMASPLACKLLKTGIPKWLAEGLAATLAAQVAVLPLLWDAFGSLSWVSVPANIAAMVLTGWITWAGLLWRVLWSLSPVAADFLSVVVTLPGEGLIRIAHGAALLPGSKVVFPGVWGIWRNFLPFVVVLVVPFKPSGLLRVAVVGLILTMAGQFLPAEKTEGIYMLDVGQGAAALCVTPDRRAVLIDCGGGNTLSNEAQRTVIPALRRLGLTRLDVLALTHTHADHAAGWQSLLDAVSVSGVMLPRGKDDVSLQIERYLRQQGIQRLPEQPGTQIRIGVTSGIRIISSGTDGASNESSLVIQWTSGGLKALVMGDAGAETEASLAEQGVVSRGGVLLAGHHGSRFSTTTDFLNLLKPEIALISVGKNTFGHPSPEVLERLRLLKIPQLRSDLSGCVKITETQGTYQIREWVKKPDEY